MVRSICSRKSWRCDAAPARCASATAARMTRVLGAAVLRGGRLRPGDDGAGNEKGQQCAHGLWCRQSQDLPLSTISAAPAASPCRMLVHQRDRVLQEPDLLFQHFVKAGARRRALRIGFERLAALRDRLVHDQQVLLQRRRGLRVDVLRRSLVRPGSGNAVSVSASSVDDALDGILVAALPAAGSPRRRRRGRRLRRRRRRTQQEERGADGQHQRRGDGEHGHAAMTAERTAGSVTPRSARRRPATDFQTRSGGSSTSSERARARDLPAGRRRAPGSRRSSRDAARARRAGSARACRRPARESRSDTVRKHPRITSCKAEGILLPSPFRLRFSAACYRRPSIARRRSRAL